LDFRYCVFGLNLHASHSIPGLERVKTSPLIPDVEIYLASAPGPETENSASSEILTYASSTLLENGEPALRIWQIADGALLRMEYFDGIQFWLDREGKTIWALWPEKLSIEDTATYLLGPVLGLLLRLRGVVCLHASAVAFGNCAVAFAGSEGAGKSTTAAALARRGHAVISDDIVAITERDGAFFVLPAYPYLSLWPESVNILYGPDKILPRLSPNWEKRQLSLAENRLRFEEHPLPLAATFLLGERSADASAPFVETLSPQESLVLLVTNSYATNVLDKGMRAREFELLGRLVTAVPVWRLRPHTDGSQIDRLCDVIQDTRDRLQVPQTQVSHPA
jgi:hypothetical protein